MIHKSDKTRQVLNIIAAPLMWILSTLPQVVDVGRTPKEFSDINDSLLVPFGLAFAIWFPIFVGCLGYAYIQAKPANKTREVFRKTGWWTGLGFSAVCGWALISTFAPVGLLLWGTALIFMPAVYGLVKAMLILTANKGELSKSEKFWALGPISLIAGWTSIAIFLNWTPILVGVLGSSVPIIVPNVIGLIAALSLAVTIIRKSGGNAAYAFPIIWGLLWLTYEQLINTAAEPMIGYGAIAGAALLIGAMFYSRKRAQKEKLAA